MAQSKRCRIVGCFSEAIDPLACKVASPLVNIITMAIAAVVAGQRISHTTFDSSPVCGYS